jgi:hypothetical protein
MKTLIVFEILLTLFLSSCLDRNNSKIDMLITLASNEDKLQRDRIILNDSYHLGKHDENSNESKAGFVKGELEKQNYEFIYFFENEYFKGLSFKTNNEKVIANVIQELEKLNPKKSKVVDNEYYVNDLTIAMSNVQNITINNEDYSIYEIVIGKEK